MSPEKGYYALVNEAAKVTFTVMGASQDFESLT
jgi:hypothetical protein